MIFKPVQISFLRFGKSKPSGTISDTYAKCLKEGRAKIIKLHQEFKNRNNGK